MVEMTARKRVWYAGKYHVKGTDTEDFEASEKDAKLLNRLKKADYKTTSQKAEEKEEEKIATEISPRTGQPKRQYRRRDMQAE